MSDPRVGSARGFRLPVISTDAIAVAIIVALWTRGVGSYIAFSLTTPKVFVAAGGQQPESAAFTAVTQGAFLLVVALCAFAVVFRINEVTRPGLWKIAVMLVPWLWLLVRSAYAGDATPDSLLFPMLVLAFAALRPNPRVLMALGVLVGLTAVIAIILGLFLPDAGIVRESDGEFRVRTDKETLPGLGLLQGMFFSENTMAAFLSVGLASVFTIRWVWARLVLVAAVLFAVVWSSSRGGIVTAVGMLGTGCVVGLLVLFQRRGWASMAARGAAAITFLFAATLALWGWDDDAFSARGIIWRVSLSEWTKRSFWFGLDPGWYARMANTETSPLHAGAVHGHNDMVQMLVTGGIVLGVMFIIWYAMIAWDITPAWSRYLPIAAMLLVGIAASGALEVVTGFVDGSSQWPVSLVPLVVLFFARRTDLQFGGETWKSSTARPRAQKSHRPLA